MIDKGIKLDPGDKVFFSKKNILGQIMEIDGGIVYCFIDDVIPDGAIYEVDEEYFRRFFNIIWKNNE